MLKNKNILLTILAAVIFSGVFLVSPHEAFALTVSGSVSPTTVHFGDSATVSWNISGATSCSITYTASGSTEGFPTTSGSMTLTNLTQSNTFILTCTDGVETKNAVAGFTVTSEITSFTASPSTIASGDSSTLSWASKNASQCYLWANGSTLGGQISTTGSYVVAPSATTEYTISCADTNRGLGSESRKITVVVSGVSTTAPTSSISANGVVGRGEERSPSPTAQIMLGGAINLNWSSTNATSCNIASSPFFSAIGGTLAPTGSVVITPESAGYINFTITCKNSAGQNSAKNIVEVAVSGGSGSGNTGGGNGSCIPNNSCAINTCTNQTCVNNCNQVVQGTKTCGAGITSFSTDRATLSSPGQVTLSWETAPGTVSCTGSGAWSGAITPLTGSKVVDVMMNSNFYLNCIDNTGEFTGEKMVAITVNNSCVPDSSCAANFCTYEVCYDGCGGVIGGTKQCNQGLCTPDNSCTFTTPVGSTCINNCGQTVPGMQSSGGGSSSGGGGGGSTPPQNTGPGGNTTGNTGPTPSMTSVTFGNIIGFSTVNDLFTKILSFLQGFIVTLALIFIVIGGFLYITSAGNEGQMETAKKCILGALIGLALGIAAPAFIKEIYSILGTNTTIPNGVGTTLSILQIAENVLSFLLTIVGIIAIIMLVIGGIMYLTAAGNEDQIDRAKKIVKYSIIGIFIALASLVLVRQVAAFFS